jgi:hypothetical protein
MNLIAAVRYLSIKYDKVDFKIDTAVIPYTPVFTQGNGSSDEVILSLSLSKYLSDFMIGINGTYSNLNNAKQYQTGMNLVYYPLGNLNLYIISGLTYHSKKIPMQKFVYHWIYTQKAGVKVFKKLWAEAGFTVGDILNYNELNAFSVYNNLETIKNRYEMSLIMPVNKNFELSVNYKYYSVEHTYLTVNSIALPEFKTTNYINHSINGGIKWTF